MKYLPILGCEKAAISSIVVLTEGTYKFRKNIQTGRQAGRQANRQNSLLDVRRFNLGIWASSSKDKDKEALFNGPYGTHIRHVC